MKPVTHFRSILTLGFLFSGCSLDTHDHVGMWCGSVSWTWSYTYFDTLYEEQEFRVDDTCWMVGRTHQALTGKETLRISGGTEPVPDGWCRYYAPEYDRNLSPDSECGFLTPAQDGAGTIFTLEQFWRLHEGQMSLMDNTLFMDANFKTATYFDGNELWGDATASYEGQRQTGLLPLEPLGGLLERRDSCQIDGCWQGSFVGNVVTGPASCESKLSTYSFDGVKIESSEKGRALTVNGKNVPTFPYLQSCELVGRDVSDEEGEWIYRLNESSPGTLFLEIELTTEAPNAGNGEVCELYWQSTGGMCPG